MTAVERRDDEAGVSVVLDTSDYLGSIHSGKPRGTQWVRGLSPEDEEYERATLRAHEEAERAAATKAHAAKQAAADQAACQWLRRPVMLGVAYLLMLLYTYRSAEGFTAMMLMDFPQSEEHAWSLARRLGENVVNFFLRVVLALALPSGLAAVCAGWLCFTVGSAAHHFTALCGVGTALLSPLALLSQVVMLWVACGTSPISGRRECDLPLVFYWVCSVVRVGAPMLALWCAGPVIDYARHGYLCKLVLALPVLALTASVMLTSTGEGRATRGFQFSYELLLPVWAYFFWRCWRQEQFALVVRELKPHSD